MSAHQNSTSIMVAQDWFSSFCLDGMERTVECGFALGMISIKPQKMCLSSHLRGVKDLAV